MQLVGLLTNQLPHTLGVRLPPHDAYMVRHLRAQPHGRWTPIGAAANSQPAACSLQPAQHCGSPGSSLHAGQQIQIMTGQASWSQAQPLMGQQW